MNPEFSTFVDTKVGIPQVNYPCHPQLVYDHFSHSPSERIVEMMDLYLKIRMVYRIVPVVMMETESTIQEADK